jgi:hypothetical protein
MRNDDAIRITDVGISYSRGVHVIQRRPELVILAVDSQGEILHERRFPTGPIDSDSATPHAIALIETSEVVAEVHRLRELEPWAPRIPVFIPPYETPEAERAAAEYLAELTRKATGKAKNPTERGVHADVEIDVPEHIVLFALNSRGERIAERRWHIYQDHGESLHQLRDELQRLLDESDPVS